MTTLNILHLSDLHFSLKNNNQSTFIRLPLFNDFRNLHNLVGNIDYVIISGDLVHNPDEEDVYLRLYDVIAEIATILTIPLEHFIICPGNHDVHRSQLRANSVFRAGLSPHAADTSYISEIYNSGQLAQYAATISRGFFEFSEYISAPWSDPFISVRNYPSGPTFISMNTATFCGLEGSAADRGKLFVPLAAIDSALTRVSREHPIFFVHHHPLGEMNEAHERAIKASFRIWDGTSFFGHIHSPIPTVESSAGGTITQMQSGALYEQNERFRGYSIYSYDSVIQARRIVYRTFFERGEFDEGVNVARHGVYFPTAHDEHAWYKRKPEYKRAQLEAFLQTVVRAEIRVEFNSALADQGLEETFVFPPFRYVDVGTAAREDGLDGIDRPFREHMLRDGLEHIVAFFPQEAGGTSFLRHLALNMCAAPAEFADCRIPMYVDLKGQKSFAAAVTRALRQAYPSIDDALFGWKAREQDQPFLVLVDNAEPESDASRDWITEAYRQFPKARFVIAARTSLAQSRVRPEFDLPFPYRAITLAPLGRREVRQLVGKVTLPEGLNKNLIVDDITARFSALGVPLTAPLIVIYLMIVQVKGRYAPINASTVIENFVEILLQKADTSKIFRDELDFGEQLSLLTRICEEMVRRSFRCMTHNELISLVTGFYMEIGIDRNADMVVSHFLERKIFESVDRNIYIKYQFVFSYLVARRMGESPEFRSFVLDYSRYGEYVQEIDIYCGLSRGDDQTLEIIARHYAQSKAEIVDDIISYMSNGEIETFELPRVDDPREFASKIAHEILADDGGQNENSDTIDDPMLRSDQFVQYMQRPELQPKLFKWIQGLQAYSVAVKNLELIPAASKSHHLQVVLNGWGEATALATKVVALCLETEVVTIAGVKIRFVIGKAIDGQILRAILIAVPRIISYYSRIFLASDKLQKQLRTADVNMIGDFIRTGILLDLRVEGYIKEVNRFLDGVADSSFMTEITLAKLRDSYFRFGVGRSDADKFRQLIAETYATVVGAKGEERTRTISRVMQDVEKRRLTQSR